MTLRIEPPIPFRAVQEKQRDGESERGREGERERERGTEREGGRGTEGFARLDAI